MNEQETQTETVADFEAEDLHEEVQALRTLMSVSLMVLIVFSFCVNWYFYRQMTMIRTEKQRVTQNAKTFQDTALKVWTELNNYGKSHADYSLLLDKYRPFITTTPAPTPTPPAGNKPK